VKELLRRTMILVALGGACLAAYATTLQERLEPLQMSERHAGISRSVSRLVEELHYTTPRLDTSASSAVFDWYLDTLDGNRMYFLTSDIAFFSSYRYQLGELTKRGQLGAVFEIFNVFRERMRERTRHALELLETEPDFEMEETFRFDRSDLGWPRSEEEMNDIWRRKVKSDALGLLLAEQSWPDIVETLTQRYERSYERIAELTSDDVFETFMNAITHTMDPHSSYLSARRSEDQRIAMSLSYEGIGARLLMEDEHAKVVDIIPGGPAAIHGELKPEDRITAVGQEDEELVDVIGWRIDDVVQLIRGPRGTEVRLRVLPAGAPPGAAQSVITLIRDRVKDEERAAQQEILDIALDGRGYKIGVIKVPSFYQDFAARTRGEEDYSSTTRDVARLIRELEAENVDGVVMDLRGNGGGHLSEAMELTGLFIDRGPVVQLRETGGELVVLDVPNAGSVYDGPLAVLVDRYSASASEIFTAAIQDYQRGIVIGQQTFGKGSVQTLLSLDRVMRGGDNGQLTLTTGKYYRVTGDSTQSRGVIPDIELPPLVPAEFVGESTRDTALPWDRVRPASYDALPSLGETIAALQRDYSAAASRDPDFRYLSRSIEAGRDARNETTVSLNLAELKARREQERAARLVIENERREALGLEPVSSLEEVEQQQAPERLQLELAARVAAKLASGSPAAANDSAPPVAGDERGVTEGRG
jgi:carboxyl-terminal processing protease